MSCRHPPLLGFFSKDGFATLRPQYFAREHVGGPASKLISRVHGLSQSRPGRDERQRKGSKCSATLPTLWWFLLSMRLAPRHRSSHTLFTHLSIFFGKRLAKCVFIPESWLGFRAPVLVGLLQETADLQPTSSASPGIVVWFSPPSKDYQPKLTPLNSSRERSVFPCPSITSRRLMSFTSRGHYSRSYSTNRAQPTQHSFEPAFRNAAICRSNSAGSLIGTLIFVNL